ncbi:MAG: NAD(P)/FAD-dependent oxidoreductase [Dehalococcoidia bacterium]|nr:NAD(P)/FAD-dependent oxidoreductase [Dehalococcoidia bacterium]
MTDKTRVLVLGGGFAGINATANLARALGRNQQVEIWLVSRHNYFLFIPMLHEAATGAVEPRHVAQPVRRAFRGKGISFLKSEVQGIDLEGRRVQTDHGPMEYDYLVLGLGSDTNFFGLDAAKPHVFELKNLADARKLHYHILEMFERAATLDDPPLRRASLTFVVAGAGPTGVELVAEIHDFVHHTVLRDYPGLSLQDVEINLVEMADRVLPGLEEPLSRVAMDRLKSKRINLLLGTRISRITDGGLELNGDREVETRTLVWTAGVRASPVVSGLPVERDRMGRVIVNQFLQAPEYPNVYVIGDSANCTDPVTKKPFPPTAQVAVRGGAHAAQNIAAAIRGGQPRPFEHVSWAGLVSLGANAAIVDFSGFRIYGRLASFIWRLVYLTKLPGRQNKVLVALDWLLSLFFERDTAQSEGG